MDSKHTPTAVCPECTHPVAIISKWTVGHLLLCPHCETILAVKSTHPIQLDWAFEEPSLANGRLPNQQIYTPHWHFMADR